MSGVTLELAADRPADSRTRQERWKRRSEWPLTGAAVLMLAAYTASVLDPRLPLPAATACRVVVWGAWAAFAVDYAARLTLSDDRRRFLRTHLLDLAVVVLPVLRPLRLLRLVTMLSVLQRFVGGSLRGRVTVYVVGSVSLVIFIAALAVLDAERGAPGANIETFPDALWWALTTVSTVGYGDHYPVTATGRFIAAGLMVAGVALLGVVTATLASWLVEQVSEAEDQAQAATRRDVAALTEQVRLLRREIGDLRRRE